jgi:signal transduction histidine kinase
MCRVPLITLQSYIEALEDPDPKDIKKFIGRLSEASTRLQHLVDDSLLFAQAQLKLLPGGTQQDPFQERTLRTLIEDAKRRHKKSDLKATVHTAVSEDVSPPLVKNVLNVVLTKIADNAAKYAKAHVNVHLFDSPTQYHVIVSDDGPGIASDLKTALFRQWGDKADIAHHDKGLGLGLKTASLFLHGVGGSIRVLDAKKLPKPVQGPPPFLLAGACFHIEIPKPGSAPGLPKSP